jgi:hypothetical protein
MTIVANSELFSDAAVIMESGVSSNSFSNGGQEGLVSWGRRSTNLDRG